MYVFLYFLFHLFSSLSHPVQYLAVPVRHFCFILYWRLLLYRLVVLFDLNSWLAYIGVDWRYLFLFYILLLVGVCLFICFLPVEYCCKKGGKGCFICFFILQRLS